MSDFNYEGVTEAINSFDLLRSTPRQIAKKAVAAFLADNPNLFQILQTDKDYDLTSKTLFAKNEYGLVVGRLVRAGGSDE